MVEAVASNVIWLDLEVQVISEDDRELVGSELPPQTSRASRPLLNASIIAESQAVQGLIKRVVAYGISSVTSPWFKLPAELKRWVFEIAISQQVHYDRKMVGQWMSVSHEWLQLILDLRVSWRCGKNSTIIPRPRLLPSVTDRFSTYRPSSDSPLDMRIRRELGGKSGEFVLHRRARGREEVYVLHIDNKQFTRLVFTAGNMKQLPPIVFDDLIAPLLGNLISVVWGDYFVLVQFGEHMLLAFPYHIPLKDLFDTENEMRVRSIDAGRLYGTRNLACIVNETPSYLKVRYIARELVIDEELFSPIPDYTRQNSTVLRPFGNAAYHILDDGSIVVMMMHASMVAFLGPDLAVRNIQPFGQSWEGPLSIACGVVKRDGFLIIQLVSVVGRVVRQVTVSSLTGNVYAEKDRSNPSE